MFTRNLHTVENSIDKLKQDTGSLLLFINALPAQERYYALQKLYELVELSMDRVKEEINRVKK